MWEACYFLVYVTQLYWIALHAFLSCLIIRLLWRPSLHIRIVWRTFKKSRWPSLSSGDFTGLRSRCLRPLRPRGGAGPVRRAERMGSWAWKSGLPLGRKDPSFSPSEDQMGK